MSGEWNADRVLHLIRRFTRGIREAALVVDPNDRIVAVNRACRNLFGYEEEELVGQSRNLLFSEGGQPASPSTTTLAGIRVTCRPKAGDGFTGELRMLSLGDGQTAGPSCLMLIRRTDETAGAPQDAKAAKGTGEVTKDVRDTADRINNALEGLVGHIELAREEGASRDAVRTNLHQAGKVVDECRNLLEEMLRHLPGYEKTRHESGVLKGAAPSAPSPSTGREILIIEDEAAIRDLLMQFLQLEGYSVSVVSDGESGMEEASQKGFRYIITDYNLPGVGGRELVEKLHGMQPDSRIILMTGRMFPEEERDGFAQAGVQGFLAKPFPLDEVRDLLQRLG